jgi:hypothetical protein
MGTPFGSVPKIGLWIHSDTPALALKFTFPIPDLLRLTGPPAQQGIQAQCLGIADETRDAAPERRLAFRPPNCRQDLVANV